MKEPLVSICCLAYNHEPYIRQCIEGFLMQKTSFVIEVLIHDDASTDKTADIIREYELKFPDLIKPIYQSENQYSKGIGVTRVYQFSRARGKYIAMCEGDDYWTDPYKLQKQVDFLENNPEFRVVHTAYDVYYQITNELISDYQKHRRLVIPQGRIYKDLLRLNFIGTLTLCARKEVLLEASDTLTGKNFPQKYIIDKTLWLEISKKHKFGYIPESTAVRRILQNSVSKSTNEHKRLKMFLRSNRIALYYAFHGIRVSDVMFLLFQRTRYMVKYLFRTVSSSYQD